ncbi:hypothetical protein PENANT_c257G01925, partial [Penicillium antarcticum]
EIRRKLRTEAGDAFNSVSSLLGGSTEGFKIFERRFNVVQIASTTINETIFWPQSAQLCPSLACGLQNFRDHGYRCHEPSDASQDRSMSTTILAGRCCVIKTTSQDRSVSTTILAGRCYVIKTTSQDRSVSTTILAGRCCVINTTSQDKSASTTILAGRSCVNKTTSQDRSVSTTILAGRCCDNKTTPQDVLCVIKCASQPRACVNKAPRRDICVNKASNDVQAPLRGVRDQYSSLHQYSKKQRPAQPHTVICFLVRRIIIE